MDITGEDWDDWADRVDAELEDAVAELAAIRDAMDREDADRRQQSREGEERDETRRSNTPHAGDDQEMAGDATGNDGESSQESQAPAVQKKQRTGRNSMQPTALTMQPRREQRDRERKSPVKYGGGETFRAPSPTKALPLESLPQATNQQLRLLSSGPIGNESEVLMNLNQLKNSQKFGAWYWYQKTWGKDRFKAWFRGVTKNCLGSAVYAKETAKHEHGASFACSVCVKQKRPCVYVKVVEDTPVPIILPEHGKAGLTRFEYWKTCDQNPALP